MKNLLTCIVVVLALSSISVGQQIAEVKYLREKVTKDASTD